MSDGSKLLHTLTPILSALLVLSPSVAPAAPATPDAGSILQQLQPVTPPAPPPAGTGLTIEQQSSGKLPPSAPFEVLSIQLSGNTLFDTASLHELVADAEGKTLTLAQLDELATRITGYYHGHGYPLARAFIPAQTIQSGIVRIEIMEARYGKINLDNRSKVNEFLLRETLSSLQSGQLISQIGLDHSLLLLSDIPGLAVNATLKPGEAAGTSDLLVEAAPGADVAGNVVLDNYGNIYTGRLRAGGTVNLNNPLHHGDYFSFSGLTSRSGLNYGRFAYESLLNGNGTRVGGSYSALHYILGDTLAFIDGNGSARVGSLWAMHPLVRSQEFNLNAQLQYDQLRLRDSIAGLQTNKHLGTWTATAAGDMRTSGAVNTWSLGWTNGRVDFDDAAAQSADAATAKTQGRFSKWIANLTRLQSLSSQNSLYLGFSGQTANANLDPSEKLTVGGPYTVRAYEMGAVSGDTGYLLTAEFRRDLDLSGFGQWQAVAFADNAKISFDKTPWYAGANSATLTGAGVGLNWTGSKPWTARLYAAKPVGSTPALVGSTSTSRAWCEIGMEF